MVFSTDRVDSRTAAAGAAVVQTQRSPFSRLQPLSVSAVRLDDTFWEPRRVINHTVTLPTQYEQLVETDRLHNFRRAAGAEGGEFVGRFFNDSDVYKWVE